MRARSGGFDWSPERDELLRHLWCMEGFSASMIAMRIPGVTRNAIIGRVHRLGMSSASRAESTRAQQHSKPGPKPVVERRPSRPRNMLRFGNVSIPKSVIPAKLPVAERIATEPVTLLERRSDQCGWPVNDGAPFLFCGAPKRWHKRYCDHHACAGLARGRAAA